MRFQNKVQYLIGFLFVFFSNASFSKSLLGNWQLNDVRVPQQNIKIHFQKKHDLYQAVVIEAQGICVHCRGNYYQRSIKGLKILWGFKHHSKNLYDEGYFLDIHSGRIYRAKIKLDQEQLYIRSYVGISLFGQTHILRRSHP